MRLKKYTQDWQSYLIQEEFRTRYSGTSKPLTSFESPDMYFGSLSKN